MSKKFRLYCGLVREGEWFNYAEVKPLEGGVLAMLDGLEKTGAARLLNLMKGSVEKFYTETGQEYILKPSDYEDIKVGDTWKIGYEAIKLKTGEEYPIIPESFICTRCSNPGSERYTDIEESWQKLVEDGYIDEIYLEKPEFTFDIELVEPIEIEPTKTLVGGKYTKITMRYLTLGDMLKIHRNQEAMENQVAMIYATWDAMIEKVYGLSDKDLNHIRRIPGQSFSKKYLNSQANQDAIEDALDYNKVGFDARDRLVYCKYCGKEIRDGLDYSNFFSLLLPKKNTRNR